MNTRKLISAVAFAIVAAPIAAHAEAPSGDFKQLFPLSSKESKTQFPRSEYRGYVEHLWLDEQVASKPEVQKTRDQVRMEIAAQPLPVIGA